LRLGVPRKPILLYSANSSLARLISDRYYGDRHYVWCSPYFGFDQTLGSLRQAASSTPIAIYKEFLKAVRTSDGHNAQIKQNRAGLLKGAYEKHRRGVISDEDRDEIAELVELANIGSFAPLIYVIPYHLVEKKAKKVGIRDLASPTSIEYRIEELDHDEFHILSGFD